MRLMHTNMAGAVTYWKTADSDIAKATAALGDHAPAPEAPASILRRALHAQYGNPTTLVRPTAKPAYFQVVEETRGQNGNDYAPMLSAWVDEFHRINTYPQGSEPEVTTAYSQAAAVMPGTRVSGGLVRAVTALGGIALRPAGAIYYIPPQSLERFEALAQAVEAAAVVGGTTAIYLLKTPTDEATSRAILDALTAESEAEAQRIEAETIAGDLGAKALRTREREADALLKRLSDYEAMLGVSLDRTRAALDKAKTAAATAALMQAGDGGEGALLYAH